MKEPLKFQVHIYLHKYLCTQLYHDIIMKGKNKQSQYNTKAVHIIKNKKKWDEMREGVFSRRPALRIQSAASSVCLRRNETTPAGHKTKHFSYIFTQ